MEPIRFADILFVFLVIVVTLSILWLVHRSKDKGKITTDDSLDSAENKDA